jgi:hypothetical protein
MLNIYYHNYYHEPSTMNNEPVNSHLSTVNYSFPTFASLKQKIKWKLNIFSILRRN